MKNKCTLIITGVFLILCGQLTAQKSQPKLSPYLDDIIQTKMTNTHIPGLASCIVKEGQIRWIGAYGYAYIDEGIPIDTSTLFYIASIAKNPDAHMSGIANILGVTRGAVMQLVLKLEKKGLVERYKNDKDSKKVFLKLTSLGEKAAIGHKQYHQEMYGDLYALLKKYKLSELGFMKEVNDALEAHLDRFLEEKR